VKQATIQAPAGAEIDRAMIPKVPGCDEKSAYAGAHPLSAARKEDVPRARHTAAHQPARRESL
jgi:hypothetical protein